MVGKKFSQVILRKHIVMRRSSCGMLDGHVKILIFKKLKLAFLDYQKIPQLIRDI